MPIDLSKERLRVNLASRGVKSTHTIQLFYETADRPEEAIYTLKQEDLKINGKTYPSLRRLYLELEDPIEYNFANTYLLSNDHWQRVCKSWSIAPEVAEWRKELAHKLRTRAMARILDELNKPDSRNYFNAIKFVMAKGWEEDTKVTNPVGRPSKEKPDTTQTLISKIDPDLSKILDDAFKNTN